MKRLSLFLLLSIGLNAQVYFTAVKSTALSGAAEVITVQQAGSLCKTIAFISASVDSTVATIVTLERNGTAATSTAITPAQLNPQKAVTSTITAYSGSNVGTSTVIASVGIAAGGLVPFDLSNIVFDTCATNQNFTIRTSSITGTVNINIKWREQ